MAGRPICVSLVLWSLAGVAAAADTCECADIADLRNREAESSAAIQAYRDALLRWAGSPPSISEPARKDLQDNQIQTEINKVTASGTNKAKGETDNFCNTTVQPTSPCMTIVVRHHERVHSEACLAPIPNNRIHRWSTLADYAIEEISAYQSEAAFVHGALSDLTLKCKLDIEMVSEIWGGMEATQSKAKGQVLATFTAPDHQPSTNYAGTGTLQYQTKDVGPPKKVGHPMLMKLAPVCYAASKGSGNVPFNVFQGSLWRSNVPPYEPRLDLSFEIHHTSETYMLKGQKGCPKKEEAKAFWSHWFLADKQITHATNYILIDNWTMAPRQGVYAEKVIKGTCGASVPLPANLQRYGAKSLAPCAETTTFTVKLKR
jgi:hypothetical protein